jgi:RES domain-containing protein
MDVYRVEKRKYLSTLLQGLSGVNHAFRWNTKGHPIIYVSETKALALLEKCANLSRPFQGLSQEYVLVTMYLPKGDYRRIDPDQLPSDWHSVVRYHPETQQIGNRFVSSDALAMFVTSSIITSEYNVLINPVQAQEMGLTWKIEEVDVRVMGV